MDKSPIILYDTTLRDGAQGAEISLTVEDKVAIAMELDRLGFDYIEGGQAGNDRDPAFFKRAEGIPFKYARLASFGPTRKKNISPKEDATLGDLLSFGTPVIALYGKSDVLHVTEVLETSLPENLRMIGDSVDFMKQHGKEVVYDAEHFFSGYRSNPEYAMETLEKALSAGADYLVLCDTKGSTNSFLLADIVNAVGAEFPHAKLGIHAHNDRDFATMNSYAAVERGAIMVQGTINGYGERNGNADLIRVIPQLIEDGYLMKGGFDIRNLTHLSRFVSETANVSPDPKQPYVGDNAFAHKGGGHVTAVLKTPKAYEHLDPESVGNARRFLVSDLSGTGNMQAAFGIGRKDPMAAALLRAIKERENLGYVYESAVGSLELLLRTVRGENVGIFRLLEYKVTVRKKGDDEPVSNATIKIQAGDSEPVAAREYGDGPVHALDNALRKALTVIYPELRDVRLVDYKVRIIPTGPQGTASKVRVHIDSENSDGRFGTVGVHENIVEASWQALVESLTYEHLRKNGSRA